MHACPTCNGTGTNLSLSSGHQNHVLVALLRNKVSSSFLEKYRLLPGLKGPLSLESASFSPKSSLGGCPWCLSGHVRSCPGLTRLGRAASEAAAPSGPIRSTWPVLLGTGCATVERTSKDRVVSVGHVELHSLEHRGGPYLPPQDLVDGCTLLQGALGHHLGPHLLHI